MNPALKRMSLVVKQLDGNPLGARCNPNTVLPYHGRRRVRSVSVAVAWVNVFLIRDRIPVSGVDWQALIVVAAIGRQEIGMLPVNSRVHAGNNNARTIDAQGLPGQRRADSLNPPLDFRF